MVRDINDPARGQIMTAGRTLLGINAGLALSDLVIAETREGSWARGGAYLAPIPGHQVATGSKFRLFYELYGARDGDTVRVQVVVSSGHGEGILALSSELVSRKYAMSLSFDDIPEVDADSVARVSRDLGCDLQPGAYTLEVSVRNRRTAETTSRRTELILIRPDRE